jgi:hypothetical protein
MRKEEEIKEKLNVIILRNFFPSIDVARIHTQSLEMNAKKREVGMAQNRMDGIFGV